MHESTNRNLNSNRLLNVHSSKLINSLQQENSSKKFKVNHTADLKPATAVRSLFKNYWNFCFAKLLFH